MVRTQYSAQFKTKVVLDVLNGKAELETIAYENNINPNMLLGWKQEFLDYASEIFEIRGRQKSRPGGRKPTRC